MMKNLMVFSLVVGMFITTSCDAQNQGLEEPALEAILTLPISEKPAEPGDVCRIAVAVRKQGRGPEGRVPDPVWPGRRETGRFRSHDCVLGPGGAGRSEGGGRVSRGQRQRGGRGYPVPGTARRSVRTDRTRRSEHAL